MASELIVFYSRGDENYVNGQIKKIDIGNTELIACMIEKLTGADTFKIEQAKPYSKSYNECIAEAQKDQRMNARPELKAYPETLDGYDVIYLGYPNYWSTMPMAVFTFLEHFDFSGKTIKPFCSNEGSGLGNSISDIRRICPDANIAKGLAIHGANISEKELKKWIGA